MAQEETQMNGGKAEFPYQSEIAMDSTLGSYTFEGWVKNPAYGMISKKGGFYLSYNIGFEYYPPALSVERKPKALQDFIIICQLWQDRRGENGKASAV
jgi:hypothetical protein